MKREYILSVMQKYGFNDIAILQITDAYDKIQCCIKAKSIFEQQIGIYEHDVMFDFYGSLNNIKNACAVCDVREEAGILAYIICLTEHLKTLYEAKKYSTAMFDGIMEDIKSKNDECYNVLGFYGTFVGSWFARFFNLTQFALGRLEFEPRYLPAEMSFDGEVIKKGTFVIAVHIPSGKPLDISQCKKSFESAYDFFVSLFPNKTVIFYCGSWLLAPDNKKLLPPNSNIVKFMDFFKISAAENTIEKDFWRIFGKADCSDFKSLPKNNSLRRIYAECAEKGKIPLSGHGILYVKNKELQI